MSNSQKGGKEKKANSKAISGSLKDVDQKRRQVFKPILDNPFTQSNLWPFVKPEVADNIIEHLLQILAPIGKYNKLLVELKQSTRSNSLKPSAPTYYDDVLVGFNSTVKALEDQASLYRRKKEPATKRQKTSSSSKYIKYVFVTKYDITPTIITSSFPTLTYTSSKSPENRVKLIQLPRGTMTKLSEVLGQTNCGIVALSNDISEAIPLYNLIESEIKDIDIPWLSGIFDEDFKIELQDLALKFLATSAPIIPKKNDQKAKKKTPAVPTEDTRDS
ncbi:RNase P and RNase MRP subunit [Scheffersomyces xylosifermentans]|uniref:RNase P and RNase MRP subunit n=1 Tax=Scheffersomyces xylosifermentans TaxID=1304137 RepID=UPI00315DB8ED